LALGASIVRGEEFAELDTTFQESLQEALARASALQ
jgi:hypothetical protein